MPDDYYRWLVRLLCSDDLAVNFQKLLWKLFDTEFIWTVDFDRNRAGDGIYLREMFMDDTKIFFDYEGVPCSVLEMMIALAMRCDDLIYDMDNPDSMLETFLDMLENLGLNDMDDTNFDESEVDYILEKAMKRRYDSYGNGGFFRVNSCVENFHVLDLWRQAGCFLDEKYHF